MDSQGDFKRERHECFYWDCIIFLVEDTLFKVPRYQFENSPIFKTTFTLPTGGLEGDGCSDERPFELQGVKKSDFEGLLKVMYNISDPPATRDAYISALKLSTMWEFQDTRAFAIECLSKHAEFKVMGAAEKVVLAMQCKVSTWLLAALEAFVKQPESLATEDVEQIGWEMAARLLRVREEFRTSRSRTCEPCKITTCVLDPAAIRATQYCSACGVDMDWSQSPGASDKRSTFNLTSTIRTEFRKQFADAEM